MAKGTQNLMAPFGKKQKYFLEACPEVSTVWFLVLVGPSLKDVGNVEVRGVKIWSKKANIEHRHGRCGCWISGKTSLSYGLSWTPSLGCLLELLKEKKKGKKDWQRQEFESQTHNNLWRKREQIWRCILA